MISIIRERLNDRFDRWINRRLPLKPSITLDRTCIFIVPTKQGLLLLLIALLVLLLAINFESALNYALAFWLISMLWVAVYMTYRNLSGLIIVAQEGALVPVGDLAEVRLAFQSSKKINRGTLELIHEDWGVVQLDMSEQTSSALLPMMAYSRGPVPLPRFRIESRFPFGLVVAWSHLLVDAKAWAYPEPKRADRGGQSSESDAEETQVNDHFVQQGTEDFHSIKAYQPGDSIKRLHWPGFSRDQLMVKTFSDYQSADEWIDWAQFNGLPDEVRLMAMSYYSRSYYEKDKPFGVRLPGSELMPEKGEVHLTRVRRVLAEYGYDQ